MSQNKGLRDKHFYEVILKVIHAWYMRELPEETIELLDEGYLGIAGIPFVGSA